MENKIKILVSVIVPVYNVERYLGECIDSILSQTMDSFELLLIDDGSSDGSAEICDQYARQDDRVKVIHKDNEGPSATRNRGLKEAIGDYIVFCDSDDIMAENALGSLYSVMINYKTDLVICGYAKFTNSIKKVLEKRVLNNFSLTIIQSIRELANVYLTPSTNLFGISIWGKMYRADIIRENSITFHEDIKYEEDCCFNLEYFRHLKTAGVLNDVLYYWRQHGTSITKVYSGDSFNYLVNGFKKRTEFLKEIKMDAHLPKINSIFLMVIISNYKKIISSGLRKNERLEAYQKMLEIPEVNKVACGCGLSKYRLTRMLTLATRAKNVKRIDLILRSWYIKDQRSNEKKKNKNQLSGIIKRFKK